MARVYFVIILDRALINTAMSRARYSIAVVGDPVVLCTFGSCRIIWEKYLEACENSGSIYPDTYNMRLIKMDIQSLAESDSGREMQRLFSQYRTQQLQQAANASPVARGLLWSDRHGNEPQHAAAAVPTPSFTTQQQLSGHFPNCPIVCPAPQTSAMYPIAVAAALSSTEVVLQAKQLQLQQNRQIPRMPMSYNTVQTYTSHSNPFNAAYLAQLASFQLQQNK